MFWIQYKIEKISSLNIFLITLTFHSFSLSLILLWYLCCKSCLLNITLLYQFHFSIFSTFLHSYTFFIKDIFKSDLERNKHFNTQHINYLLFLLISFWFRRISVRQNLLYIVLLHKNELWMLKANRNLKYFKKTYNLLFWWLKTFYDLNY